MNAKNGYTDTSTQVQEAGDTYQVKRMKTESNDFSAEADGADKKKKSSGTRST